MQRRMIRIVSVLTGLLFLQCESLTLISKGSIDGGWTFRQGDRVTLTCSIPSYTGEMTWKFHSADAAKCTPQVCNQIITGDDGFFIFGFDTSSYNFTWTFTPTKSIHHGKIFECFDGVNTKMFTAVVNHDEDTPDKPVIPIDAIDDVTLAAIILAMAGFVFLSIVLIVLCCAPCRTRCKCSCCSIQTCSLLFFQTESKQVGMRLQPVTDPRADHKASTEDTVKKLKDWNNSLENICVEWLFNDGAHADSEAVRVIRKRVAVETERYKNTHIHAYSATDETKELTKERMQHLSDITAEAYKQKMWVISYLAMCQIQMTFELQKLHNEMTQNKKYDR